MDYDFHLFTERATGQDSVICRAAGGYRLQLAGPPAERPRPRRPVDHRQRGCAPRLPLSETTAWLDASGQTFLLFTDAGTGPGTC